MRMNIDTNKGQLSGGDIHNHHRHEAATVTVKTLSGGLNFIGNHGDIHLHLTLPDAETLAALTELLKLATGGKRSTM